MSKKKKQQHVTKKKRASQPHTAKKPKQHAAKKKKAAAKRPAATQQAARKPTTKRQAAKKRVAVKRPSRRRPSTAQGLPSGYQLREPERVASASIDGYWYQILHTVREWLDLDRSRMLIAEGNEDLDQTSPFPHVSLGAPEVEIQIKHRCTPISQGDEAIWMAISRYLVAFAHHHRAGRTFLGVLRTNALISANDSTQIGRWILRQAVDTKKFIPELRAIVDKHDGDVTEQHKKIRPAFDYINKNALTQEFIDSVQWAPTAGSVEDIRTEIAERVARRAPDASTNLLVDALLVHLVSTITKKHVADRQLRAIDADIAISDGALEALQRGAARAASGGTVFVWSQKGPPFVSCAIWVEHPEMLEERLQHEANRDAVLGTDRDMKERLRGMIASLDFVAYVSVRRLRGPRGLRACIRDVVRQARHRHTPQSIRIADSADVWLDAWIAKKWPAPTRCDAAATEAAGLALAELVAHSVIAKPRDLNLVADIGSKMRWAHMVDDESYWTAENPMPLD